MANFSASVVRIKNNFFFWGDEFRISRLFDSTLIRSSEAHFYSVICSTNSELVHFCTCSCLEASLPTTFHVQSLDSTLIRSSEAHFYSVICSTSSELVQFCTCSCLEASLPATFHVQSLDALNSSPIGEAYETICEFIDIFPTLGSSKGTSQMLLMKLPMGNFCTTVI
jgi:hypothetical protein